jgi:site-specific recombinase XerD
VSAALTRTRAPKIAGRDMTPANEAAFRGLARSLRAAGKSDKTAAAYHQACLSLEAYLLDSGGDGDLLAVTEADVTGWLIALQDLGGWRRAPGGTLARLGRPMAKDSVNSYFSSARRFYNWAAGRGLVDASPMARLEQPPVSGKPVPVPEAAFVQAMLATCQAPRGRKRSFADFRDEFMIRLFAETGGPRCSELAGLTTERLDMREDVCLIAGKGDKWRVVPMSAKTADAAQLYLRARAAHRAHALPVVFLGQKGELSPSGVYQAIAARAERAGGKLHPHQLRHFAADRAKSAGLGDEVIMTLFGWSTDKMLHRYGAAHAQQRAVAIARQHALGDAL